MESKKKDIKKNIKKRTYLYKYVGTALCTFFLAVASCLPVMAANVRTPQASGTVTYGNTKATIDASHASDGYIMIKYTGSNPKIKVRIQKNTQYDYNLSASGQYETFPLSEGSGTYSVKIFENVSGTSYSQAVSESISVNLSSETSPFLYPNQFCNFSSGSAVVSVADSLTSGLSDPLAKVEAVFNYTVDNIAYDNQKAASVQSGYLPNVDTTLSQKTGICFDYAAVMTSMLRVEDIPTKLVIGYAGNVYHAWVSVYVDGQGWLENVIYFDGNSWKYVDPTFISSGKRSQQALDFVSNAANYQAKFTY